MRARTIVTAPVLAPGALPGWMVAGGDKLPFKFTGTIEKVTVELK